jgi:hypothetical protein
MVIISYVVENWTRKCTHMCNKRSFETFSSALAKDIFTRYKHRYRPTCSHSDTTQKNQHQHTHCHEEPQILCLHYIKCYITIADEVA